MSGGVSRRETVLSILDLVDVTEECKWRVSVTSSVNLNILECIDEGLDSIGESGKKTVYWYLSKRFKMKTEDIPDRPSSLTEALKTLFGQGAGILERTIMRELKQTFKITLGEDLEEVVSLVKQAGRSLASESTSIKLH